MARTVVPALAGLVLGVSLLLSLLGLGYATSQVCDDQSTPDMVADCNDGLVSFSVRGGISVVLAVCAILTARRARTAQNAWSGGLVLLIAAVVLSPVFDVLAG